MLKVETDTCQLSARFSCRSTYRVAAVKPVTPQGDQNECIDRRIERLDRERGMRIRQRLHSGAVLGGSALVLLLEPYLGDDSSLLSMARDDFFCRRR